MELWTVGYGAWPVRDRAKSLIAALSARNVTRLVDIRLNPCASDPTPGRPYGPKPWNLQIGKAGLVGLLATAGIAYEWIVELGNPQRRDPSMTILRALLADSDGDWPVHRGMERLAGIVRRGEVVAILCACGDARKCHRTVVAEELARRHFEGNLEIREI